MAKSKKLPAFQFYPGDWRKDPSVQALEFHDRGVWFEMLCLMHESPDRGKLILPNGTPLPDDAIARIIGLDKQKFNQTLTTLLLYGVAKQDPDTKVIFNKRMVEDERIRRIRAEAGKLGGNPQLIKNKVKQKTTTGDNQKSTPSSSSSSSISSSNNSTLSDTSDRADIPYIKIVNLFHEHTKSFGIIKKITAARRNSIKARWSEYKGIDSFKKAFINAEDSDFLTGRDGEWNNCSFDNLLTSKIFTKCIEGGYAGKKKADKSDKPELPTLAEPEGWRICLEVLCGTGFDGDWQMFCDSQRELALDIIKKLK